MASSLIKTQNQTLVSLNDSNAFSVNLNLSPPIVNVNYCRIVSNLPCLIETDLLKPIYILNQTTNLADTQTIFPVYADILFRLSSNIINFQFIKIVSPIIGTTYDLIFQFYESPFDSNLLQ